MENDERMMEGEGVVESEGEGGVGSKGGRGVMKGESDDRERE